MRALGVIPMGNPTAQSLAPSQADVRAQLLGSDEYYARQGGRPARFVSALYRDAVGRSPSYRELVQGVNAFAGAGSRGPGSRRPCWPRPRPGSSTPPESSRTTCSGPSR